jgi:hypothetical protein
MPNGNAQITDKEIRLIIQMKELDGLTFSEIGRRLERDRTVCRKYYNLNADKHPYHLDESPYPRYDNPIEDEGDALILPDPEIPFHHAEFINRCIDLAIKWDITHLIVPGDLVHFASMSGWAPNWEADDNNDISENAEKALIAFANTLPQNQKQAMIDLVVGFDRVTEGGLSAELAETKKQLTILTGAFKTATLDIGNHEGRLLTTLNNPLSVDDLKQLLNIGSWKVAPYYFSFLTSNGERFKITHPKPYSDKTPVSLAAIEHCHMLVAHSHKLISAFDPSGKFYAWHIGCCVDEKRLAYVGQRDRTSQPTPHMLGAVIVRDGIPWQLHERSPWKELEKK